MVFSFDVFLLLYRIFGFFASSLAKIFLVFLLGVSLYPLLNENREKRKFGQWFSHEFNLP
jgi:hypothetical protein